MSHLLLPNSIFALPTNKIEKLISTRLHFVCLKHLLFLFLTSLKGIFFNINTCGGNKMFGRELRGTVASSGVRSSMLVSFDVTLQKLRFSPVNFAAEVLVCALAMSHPSFVLKIPLLPTVRSCEVWLLTEAIL